MTNSWLFQLSVEIITDNIKCISSTYSPCLSLLITMRKMLLSTDVAWTVDSVVSYAVDTRNQSDRYIVGGLNISKSKIGRSVSDVVCMRPRDRGAKLHSWSSFRVACVLTFRAPLGRFDVGMQGHL